MHARERFVATLEELENRIFTEESDPRIRNFRLIDESLAILKERVQLDYAGILLLKGSEKIVIHENGRLTPSDSREETLNRQIRQAVRHTEEPGRYAYLCPSESSKG